MTPRPLVHVFGHIHPSALKRLAEAADILTDADPFPSACDGIVVRTKSITAGDIAACPSLKVIGKHGVGTDAIDVAAARERGIPVFTTPGANAESVADLAVGFALSLVRNVHEITLALKQGRAVEGAMRVGWELGELRAGIFGFGAVGQAVAKRLRDGFGADVAAFDPGIADDAWPRDIERVPDLSTLAKQSRLLFVHVPLVAATRHSIDADLLRSMPAGSFLVNCARGGVVDEGALADAIRSCHIAGAACDVFQTEPPEVDNPLLGLPGFLATPHLGASTHRGLERVGIMIVEKVLAEIARSRAAA